MLHVILLVGHKVLTVIFHQDRQILSDIADIFLTLLAVNVELTYIGAHTGNKQNDNRIEEKDPEQLTYETFCLSGFLHFRTIHGEIVPPLTII